MKKTALVIALAYMAMTAPAFAKNQNTHALGDMYTAALNMIESCGMLDTLDMKKYTPITDIHMNHGQVIVTVTASDGPKKFVYDPIAHKLLFDVESAK